MDNLQTALIIIGEGIEHSLQSELTALTRKWLKKTGDPFDL